MSSRLIQFSGKIKQFFPASHFYKNFDNKNIIKMIFQQGCSCWIQNVIFACQSKNKNLWKYLQSYLQFGPPRWWGGGHGTCTEHCGHCAGWYLSNILKKVRVILWCLHILNNSGSEPDQTRKSLKTCRVKIRIYYFIKIAWNKAKYYHILS